MVFVVIQVESFFFHSSKKAEVDGGLDHPGYASFPSFFW